VFPGAAWAATEYVRTIRRERLESLSEREREVEMRLAERGLAEPVHTGLKIVPVGIVYTDKGKYMSRVSSVSHF
jgi:glycerol-3-phosphate O-acyltransferase/dihydroxyacetone phosphate acyltransferase